MAGLLYIFVIIGGVLGLAAIVFFGSPLTVETAPMLTAKAAIAIAFVVIPYCTARALERVQEELRAKRLQQKWERKIQRTPERLLTDSKESFFEYLFGPSPKHSWYSGSAYQVKKERPDDSSFKA